MKIKFNGAAQTVTGSQFLIEANHYSMLLECGMFQGRRQDTYQQNRNFKFNPKEIQTVVLSHAHIDHSGNLPNLVLSGFEGPIYTTTATARLGEIMLEDSGHIQEEDAQYLNKKRAKNGESPIEPLYTASDAIQACQQFHPVRYNDPFEPIPGVTVQLIDAGHILGSAAICLDVKENGNAFRFWFSGDIGRMNLPLIPDPVLPEGADYLMMECTYGDKAHRDPADAYSEFRDVIKRTIKRRGKVIVPAFAVGRTQELVYDINQMIEENEIPRVPVFVDSPLAVKATEVFKSNPEYFDEETRKFINENRHPALAFNGLEYISDVNDSKKLNFRKEPMIIISASGMAENGRILHHLANNIEDERNTICIVGWQAPYTLGRRLAERQTSVNIFGERYFRRAEVATIGGLSAHAGQDFLLKYAQATQSSLKQIVLVHGEQDAAEAFKQVLNDNGMKNINYPVQYDEMEI
jgi:metallo-beta-lactamase family protein